MLWRSAVAWTALIVAGCWMFEKPGDDVCDVTDDTRVSVQKAFSNIPPVKIDLSSISPDANAKSVFEHKWERRDRLVNSIDVDWQSMEVYFVTADTDLDNWDLHDLDQFADYINWLGVNEISIRLEWHADARDNISYNEQLGRWRIASVERYLRSKINRNITVDYNGISYWETQASGRSDPYAMREERKVNIGFWGNAISRGLEQNPADVYLLDASGSMNQTLSSWNTRWSYVENFQFPWSSKIFTFNTDNSDGCSESLETQEVQGETAMYDSLVYLMKSGEFDNKTITVLSDGYDNVSGSDKYSVVVEAKKRGIRINVIWTGTSNKANLLYITTETWGSYTFER